MRFEKCKPPVEYRDPRLPVHPEHVLRTTAEGGDMLDRAGFTTVSIVVRHCFTHPGVAEQSFEAVLFPDRSQSETRPYVGPMNEGMPTTNVVELGLACVGDWLKHREESARRRPQEPDTAPCDSCGGAETLHTVVEEYEHTWSTPSSAGKDSSQIIECNGCRDVRYRDLKWSTNDIDDDTGRPRLHTTIYPAPTQRRSGMDVSVLPKRVGRIYSETLKAMAAGAPTLTAGGLRAIVEAICLDQGVSGANLQSKIDTLEKRNLLTKPQAELLHEERYLGNAALHELVEPAAQDLNDGLDIIETLLTTIYVLPSKAKRLREGRNKQTIPLTIQKHAEAPLLDNPIVDCQGTVE